MNTISRSGFRQMSGGRITMNIFWRFSHWLGRLVLLAAASLFIAIGVKYVSAPVHMAATDGITLGSGMAITRLRIGFGAFPLGFAIILLFCLVSKARLLAGLGIVATLDVVILAVRLLSIPVDHSLQENLPLLRAEIILLLLCLTGIVLEFGRRRNHPDSL
jgi:hypothetical protein